LRALKRLDFGPLKRIDILKLFASLFHPFIRTPYFLDVEFAFQANSWNFALLSRIAMEAVRS
jgi:hypothetical protein